MTRFLSLFAVLTLIILPATLSAMAQEDADAVLAAQEGASAEKEINEISDGEYKTRLELAQQMHKVWPIRQKVESALDAVAERIPEKDQLNFKAAMRKSIKFDALEETSIDAMADIFSEKELEKMIEFYGSKEGRSVSHKTGDYERALQPVMIKMLDKALLDAKLGSQSFPPQ